MGHVTMSAHADEVPKTAPKLHHTLTSKSGPWTSKHGYFTRVSSLEVVTKRESWDTMCADWSACPSQPSTCQLIPVPIHVFNFISCHLSTEVNAPFWQQNDVREIRIHTNALAIWTFNDVSDVCMSQRFSKRLSLSAIFVKVNDATMSSLLTWIWQESDCPDNVPC